LENIETLFCRLIVLQEMEALKILFCLSLCIVEDLCYPVVSISL
jgi:hypothetical protein